MSKRSITSKIFYNREEVEQFMTEIMQNWNLHGKFIQIVPTLHNFIVFYEKCLDEKIDEKGYL